MLVIGQANWTIHMEPLNLSLPDPPFALLLLLFCLWFLSLSQFPIWHLSRRAKFISLSHAWWKQQSINEEGRDHQWQCVLRVQNLLSPSYLFSYRFEPLKLCFKPCSLSFAFKRPESIPDGKRKSKGLNDD
jgi:hypothetical protein